MSNSISGLYFNYGTTSDEDLRKYLTRYKLVLDEGKGYFPFTESAVARISDKLRKTGFNMDDEAFKFEEQPIEGLTEWKIVEYLVKSSSRFILKIDIGEIFDAIDWEDLMIPNTFKAIAITTSKHTLLPDTEGEHFLLTAKLLR